ncbi:hypothetical protein AMAG_01028 [Allomyces macrogynus ATCC 38327]|uniref:Uncharacterized protein n=1 Tax=Allomyces macrogynus (strain ATCC 38327) TaxID=578462 RepID=A0A0L0RYD4_ALLM3|nr:hypothetical protein AMAG_01028 [Allomyces macrogynus ATCC 38327]|eukprot:KNE55094.1 hypothetical protein AMAG_01028 [Allomyces macrogynus ATCC 38327]
MPLPSDLTSPDAQVTSLIAQDDPGRVVLSGDRTGRVVEHVLSFDHTSTGALTPSVAPVGLVARFPGPCTHLALGPNRFAACVGAVVYVMVTPAAITTGSKQSSASVAHRPVSKSTSSRPPSAAAARSVWATASRICLEGHQAPVICSEFGRSGEWLVTLAEDKTFKVWDLVQARCCYQSEILCPLAQLTHLAIDPVAHHLYVGSDDCILRVYAYKAVRGSRFSGSKPGAAIEARMTAVRTSSKESRAIRFEPRIHAVINLAQPAGSPDDDAASKPADIVISARGSTISPGDLGLGAKSDSATSLTDPVMDPIIATARVDHLLYIVTATRLVVVDSNTLSRVAHVDLVQPDPDNQSDAARTLAVGRVDRVTFLNLNEDAANPQLTAVVSCPFDGSLKFLSFDSHHASGSNDDDAANPRIQLAIDRIGTSNLHPSLHVSTILPAVLQALRGGHQLADSMWSKHTLATVSASLVTAGVTTLADVARLGKDAWTRMALPLGVPAILAGLATRATTPTDARNPVEQFDWSSVPVAHLPAGSPMRKFLWSTKTAATDPRDKPVTFRKTVTSSGYTSAPFVPKHLAKKPAAAAASARPKSGMTRSTSATSVRSTSSAGGGEMLNEWMDEWLSDADDGDGDTSTVVVPRVAPRIVTETHVHPSAVTAVAVSTRGSKTAVGTSDRAICLMSTRTMASTATSFQMPQLVQTVAWNHDDSLVAASTRQAVAVWDARPSTEKSSLVMMIEEPYAPESIVGAQFFYQSRFLVVGHGNAVELVKFRSRSGSADNAGSDAGRKSIRSSNSSLNKGTVTGVQPRRQAGESKVVVTVPLEGAQYLTCLAADNLAANPWVLVGASDKSVALLDMATSRVAARVNPSAETGELPPVASVTAGGPRAPYALRVPAGAATPLFVTTAVNDLVKVWDARTMRVVHRLGPQISAPRSRAAGAGACLSPCGTLVAVPTDEPSRPVALFDMRKSGGGASLPETVPMVTRSAASAPAAAPASLLRGAKSDLVAPIARGGLGGGGGREMWTAVDFHPRARWLVAGSSRGHCALYGGI